MSDLVQGFLTDSDRPSSSRRAGGTGCSGYPVLALLAGLGLIVAAAAWLAWNEMHAVGASSALTEGAASVRTIQADQIDPANDGKLVHLVGMATTAKTVALGAYQLSGSLLDQMGNFQPLVAEQVPGGIDRKIQLWEGGFYVGNNPAAPEIGDLRLHYDRVTPTTVSVISKATGRTFEPYRTRAGGTIDLLVIGEHSAPEMFATTQGENVSMTWFLRVLGALMILLGSAAAIIGLGWIYFIFKW